MPVARHALARRKRFQIRYGKEANVYLFNPDTYELERYCCHIGTDKPAYDIMLAQKLWLDTDEKRFVKKANKQ